MSESSVEPWPRVIAQAAWRFGVVFFAVGLVAVALTRLATALSLASGLAGLVALVDGSGRAARGRPPWTARLLASLTWPAAALWSLGCLLQASYVRVVAEVGQEAAWRRMWGVLAGPDAGLVLAICAVATAAAPVLVFARLKAARLGGQIALATVPAAGVGAASAFFVFGVFQPGALSSAFAPVVVFAGLAVAGMLVGVFVLRGLDVLEERHAAGRSLDP